MRGQRRFAIGVIITLYGTTLGCQSAGPKRPIVTTEPGLASSVPMAVDVKRSRRRRYASDRAGEDRHVGRSSSTVFKAARLLGYLWRQQDRQGSRGDLCGRPSRYVRRGQANHRRDAAGCSLLIADFRTDFTCLIDTQVARRNVRGKTAG